MHVAQVLKVDSWVCISGQHSDSAAVLAGCSRLRLVKGVCVEAGSNYTFDRLEMAFTKRLFHQKDNTLWQVSRQ